MIFVDTNYFLRFLRDDVREQTDIVRELFNNASRGNVQLCTSTIVFFEIYWVLTSFYQTRKREVVKVLQGILAMSFIVIREREILTESVDVFAATNIGLEDAYNLAYAQAHQLREFRTFDKKLAKIFNTRTF
jgi:predicted nucleic acid-binding protein